MGLLLGFQFGSKKTAFFDKSSKIIVIYRYFSNRSEALVVVEFLFWNWREPPTYLSIFSVGH